MAAPGRFASSSDDEIAKILAEKDSVNTKRCTKAAVKCFIQYLTESNVDSVNFDDYKPEELAVWLTKFYADARKKNGEKYKLTALKSIRFGLARYFNSEHELDIVKDSRFKKANDVFMAMSVNLKREGLAHVDHTVPLEEDELKQIYTSVALNPDTPVGLQQKVWFDVMYFLCRRGRENLRTMTKETFKVKTDNKGRKYVYQHIDELDKNHRENADPTESVTEGRMYGIKDHPLCPVSSFEKYVSKLHPDSTCLWQRPADSFDKNSAWYLRIPVGKNTLSHMMKVICKQAGVSSELTNHSIRATSITVLDVRKFSNRDIMSVSGHRSETSIKSYTSRVSTERKHDMSKALLEAAVPAHVNINNVTSEVDCNGIIDMTPDQLEALLAPMETAEQKKENCPTTLAVSSNTCNNIQTQLNTIPQTMGQFTPYITGCVVNFYMK